MKLKNKILRYMTPIFILLFIDELLYTEAYMKSVRIEEIPFGLTPNVEHYRKSKEISPLHMKNPAAGIHAIKNLEMNRSFFHIFKIPYIICFFAARGKWPFIPPFMQNRVDAAARTLFSQNDSYIKQFCQKWIQIKECFRPNSKLEIITVSPKRQCECANLQAATESAPVIFFDRDHIGNVSADTIRNTIEFLENFLPPKSKKNKRKNRVRSRVDEMDIE
ncbi:uncharacterized protein LOC119644389 [Glossina fuscipes]|uniref:Uncharacterized protein LOC119644389 n=1 Tax=Glossina fuscipes TaxID=7396 RepID=A0A9C5ZQN4_9MUSC|nr:uncharacterized protein LOC119644389 [Glossina fuscipes]